MPEFQMVADEDLTRIRELTDEIDAADARAVELTLGVGEIGERIAALREEQQPLLDELNELNGRRHTLRARRANYWWPAVDGPPPWSPDFDGASRR